MANPYYAAIIIPARYGSTRFPGKPLAELAGKAMLRHVYERALAASDALSQQFGARAVVSIRVATDDTRIADYCAAENIPVTMTSDQCRTGSDRVLEAAHHHIKDSGQSLDFVLNLQGDNPFAAREAMVAVLGHLIDHADDEGHSVATPVLPLSWDALDRLRADKAETPFSGTTVVMQPETNKALWFSKQILPALRKEEKLRAENSDISPVFRHIGLYGYRLSALEKFVSLPEGQYEALEGLEQLRFLENNIGIYGCPIAPDAMPPISGIDTAEDLARAEKLIAEGLIKID